MMANLKIKRKYSIKGFNKSREQFNNQIKKENHNDKKSLKYQENIKM